MHPSVQVFVADDQQAWALACMGLVDSATTLVEESSVVRETASTNDARAKAAPPAAPTPQVTLGCYPAYTRCMRHHLFGHLLLSAYSSTFPLQSPILIIALEATATVVLSAIQRPL